MTLTWDEAVAKLDAIAAGDPESTHSLADDILLDHVRPEVRAAYDRAVERENGRWWFA